MIFITDRTKVTTKTPFELLMLKVPRSSGYSLGLGTYIGFFVILK